MLGNFVQATHIAAGLMFILALAGLRRRETARRSTAFGILGMVFALVATGVAIAHDGLAAGSALWDAVRRGPHRRRHRHLEGSQG